MKLTIKVTVIVLALAAGMLAVSAINSIVMVQAAPPIPAEDWSGHCPPGSTDAGTDCTKGVSCGTYGTGTGAKPALCSRMPALPDFMVNNVTTSTPATLATTVWNWFLVIAAAICIIVIIWAGITYATAGGDEEKVKTAKSRLIYGIIGVAVIIAAYAITQFIKITLDTTTPNPIPTPEL